MKDNDKTVKYVVTPPVDVFENADEYKIVADLPGVKKDDLHVSWAPGEVSVEGQDGDRLFRRAFSLPDGVDAEGIGADLANGVLTLTLPKAAEVKPRRIEVRSA